MYYAARARPLAPPLPPRRPPEPGPRLVYLAGKVIHVWAQVDGIGVEASPLARRLRGRPVIALGETAGAVMSAVAPAARHLARVRIAAKRPGPTDSPSAEYDSDVIARTVYVTEPGSRSSTPTPRGWVPSCSSRAPWRQPHPPATARTVLYVS